MRAVHSPSTPIWAGALVVLLTGQFAVPPPVVANTQSVERELRRCANQERVERGLPRLRPSRSLGQAARSHARSMRRHGYVDHTDPRGRGPQQRVSARTSAYRAGVGENIATGGTSTRQICRAWMRSPGHRKNILRPTFDHLGVGYARGGTEGRYLVQVFGDRGR